MRYEMHVVEEFTCSYAVDTAPGWPGRVEEVIPFLAYDKLGMHTGTFQDIRFQMDTGDSWIGQFELGQREKFEHAIFSVPDPRQALVISSGAGYWVDVERKCVIHLECLPITQVVVAKTHALIIIATWKDLYAYSSPDALWSSRNLAEDRLRIIQINKDLLEVVGWNMGEMERMHVNLTTGELL